MGNCCNHGICCTCLSPDGFKNMLGCGKECCKICYCCLEEEHRVGRVFDHFTGQPVAMAAQKGNGHCAMFVGRVTLPDNPETMGMQQCCYSPGTQSPSVYWRVTVEEEWCVWRRVEERDSEGNVTGHHYAASRRWNTIVDKENSVDFYLQDGVTKIFVHGSKRDDIRVQSEWDGGGDNKSWMPFSHTELPDGIQWLVNTHATDFGGWARAWHSSGWGTQSYKPPDAPTGNFRWAECKFEVNEKMACLGVASASYQDPHTQTIAMGLIPMLVDAISPDQMQEDAWSRWDKWSWIDMMKDDADGAVMLTDKTKYTDSVDVQPALNLPRWMTVLVPQYTPWGGTQMVQAVVPNQTQLVAVDTDGDGNPDNMAQVVMQPAVVQQQVAVDADGDGVADTMMVQQAVVNQPTMVMMGQNKVVPSQ